MKISKNKYYDRAKELLIPYSEELLSNQFLVKAMQSDIIEEMCKLAEEVEKETVSKMISSNPKDKIVYTKKQVEELLAKQRELCANEARIMKITWDELNSIPYRSFYIVKKDITPINLSDDNAKELAIIVNTESILNAKLKID